MEREQKGFGPEAANRANPRQSKQVLVGGVPIGGGAPVTVQSMLNVPSTDIPGSVAQAVALAEFVRDMGYNPEQVQDFYPTPSTISTVMFGSSPPSRSG